MQAKLVGSGRINLDKICWKHRPSLNLQIRYLSKTERFQSKPFSVHWSSTIMYFCCNKQKYISLSVRMHFLIFISEILRRFILINNHFISSCIFLWIYLVSVLKASFVSVSWFLFLYNIWSTTHTMPFRIWEVYFL